jgi:F0F1-type ATP synthase assembly protein I
MITALFFLTGLLIGFVAGLLVYRRHSSSLKATEDKAKSALDSFKK